MKKFIIALIIVISFYCMIGTVSSLIIPDDAIRIRIIANSNSDYDQEIKNEVKKVVEDKMYNLLKNAKGSDEARTIINNNLTDVSDDIELTLQKLNYTLGYDINYGLNYFPSKEYKGITYQEGYYESLVVTLGSGEGDNWWCVLFPPLCLLEAEESDNVQYTSYVKEMITKYMNE